MPCQPTLLPPFQSKFIAFYQYSKNFNSDTFDYPELEKTDFVFMRWKEHFLVPDHTIKVGYSRIWLINYRCVLICPSGWVWKLCRVF